MGAVLAVGEALRVRGFALAGVSVVAATGEPAVLRAWEDLPADAALLILTPAAERVLHLRLGERPRLLVAVIPE